MVKVIASGVRKGNVIEHEDGKLYVVLKAESMHPGKGTPTTTIDMRRISDGVKTVVRYKTTDPLERAFVETITHSYLYQDGDNFVFMNPETDKPFTTLKKSWASQVVERAQLVDFTFHDLRHEASSRLFEKGLNVPEVAVMSGHRDPRMLFRYTHPRPEDIARKLAGNF